MPKNKPTPPTRKPGRPRNPELDRLQAELACTRRHAKRLLAGVARNIASPAKSSEPAPATGSPIGFARLAKLLKETEFLESKVRQALIAERHLAGELLYFDEAVALATASQQAIANTLRAMPKTLAPRLSGQPQKAIEKTLAEWADTLLSLTAQGVGRCRTPHKL